MNVAKARWVKVDCKRKRSMFAKEGQQNCELKLGDGVGTLSSLCTVLPDYRDSVRQQCKGRPFCPFCTRHKLAPMA